MRQHKEVQIVQGSTVATVDPLGYLAPIEIEHHQVHDEQFYTMSDYAVNVQAAAPKEWFVRTPNTVRRFHCKISVEVDGGSLLEFFENPVISGGDEGTLLPFYNNDRNSLATATVSGYKDPTVGNSGVTRLQVSRVAPSVGKKVGGVARIGSEWILKQNTDYLLRVTVDANGTEVTTSWEGYEVNQP